jgi:hypothetical protein
VGTSPSQELYRPPRPFTGLALHVLRKCIFYFILVLLVLKAIATTPANRSARQMQYAVVVVVALVIKVQFVSKNP